MSRPMPLAAPVIRIFRPASLPFIFQLSQHFGPGCQHLSRAALD
jgi:hypothetical protein